MFEKLIKWSKANHNDLPWRENRTLYTTLVSEIMLQQTTVSTVLNHYERFLQKYPTLESLAQDSEDNLTIEWKGLGYYRRARNLKRACEEIKNNFDGKVPLDYNDLVGINGIGEYTANAIIAIGANKRALAIDANLERVISRIYGIKELKGKKLQDKIKQLFASSKICQEIDELGAREFNEALMDLGREFCKANKTYCEVCPMNRNCYSIESGDPLALPIKEQEKKIMKYFDLKLLRLIVEENEKILTYKKAKNEWLSNQFEIPSFTILSEDILLNQYPKIPIQFDYELLPMLKTGITKYRIENYLLALSLKEFEELGFKQDGYQWKPINNESNLSTTTHKILKFLDYEK